MERPILCGVFMQDVSPRTVLVGFPERAHYAFDAQNSRLAKLWRGRFFNARGTWHARAGELESPPVDDVLELAPGAPFVRLASDDAPWPDEPGRELGYRALGRRFDVAGVPTFRYAFDGVEVEDTVRPRVTSDGVGMTRRLFLAGDVGGLDWRVAVGDVRETGGAFDVDGARFTLQLPPGATARVRDAGGAREILVRLPLGERAELEVAIAW
jgi:hypothetical protein